MNYIDSEEIALAVKNICLSCFISLPDDMEYEVIVNPRIKNILVNIIDKRNGGWEYHTFRYNERVSSSLNGLCFDEWLHSVKG